MTPEEAPPSQTRMGPGDTTGRREPPPRREPPRRNGLVGLFVDDWPLKLLALVLAVMMWRLTRDRLTRSEEFSDVMVAVEGLPSGVEVTEVFPPQGLKVTVFGTRAQIERAREAFRANGKRVTVQIPHIERGEVAGSAGPISDPLRFTYPFDEPEIVTNVTAPTVSWVRIDERTVSVFAPEVLIPAGTAVAVTTGWPQVETATVVVRAPSTVLAGLSAIPLDPVDAGPWLASKLDFVTPMRFEASFEQWRAIETLRAKRFCTITPERIQGTVKFRRTGTRLLSHALQLMMPAGSVDAFKGWEVVVDGREYDAASQRITLPVRADSKTLDDMQARSADWDFAIKVPTPPQAGEPPVQNVKVPVVLAFSPAAATWSRAGPVPATLEGSPTVFLTLRKRD